MAIFDEPSRKPLPGDAELADHRTAVIKSALGSIPVVGGFLVEELGLVLTPPLARRRDEWLQDLARRLHHLEEAVEGFRFDDLGRNEQFVSATVQATQSALRTHRKEKLEALRNAVVNVATGSSSSAARQEIFLSLVDSLQPVHLRLLKQMAKGVFSMSYTDAARLFAERIAELDGFGLNGIKLLIEDLRRAGLVNVTSDGETLQGGRWLTDWALEFLDFITEPSEKSSSS